MGPRLAVDPVSYEAASFAFGAEIAGDVQRAALGLLDGLAGSYAMAGADPAGDAWAAAYDPAARLTVGVAQDVINGCYRLAALLQQTGFNYIRADSSSTPGGVELPARRHRVCQLFRAAERAGVRARRVGADAGGVVADRAQCWLRVAGWAPGSVAGCRVGVVGRGRLGR